ncbi:MAG: YitT family protein [Firmicutes bacterium]|nr:YitT family protein [Bacillota bacterium]
MRARLGRWSGPARDFLQMVAGAALLAFSINGLIVPNRLGDGGFAGLAVLIHYLTGWPVSWLYPALNVPLLALGWWFIGPGFIVRTLVGIGLVSAWLPVFSQAPVVLQDALLASVYAGVVSGAGIGLLMHGGGSSGGTDILARFLNDWRGVSYTVTYLAFDVLVLGGLAFWVGVSTALYAWIVTYIAGRVVTFIVEGPVRGKAAMIVTSEPRRILAAVTRELGRGATVVEAQGGYTAAPRKVVWVVVSLSQIYRLRQLVAEADPDAFVTVMDATEVLGQGFGRLPAPRRRRGAAGRPNPLRRLMRRRPS